MGEAEHAPSTPAGRRAEREKIAETSMLSARHKWEHKEISKGQMWHLEDMIRDDLRRANERDG